MFIKVSLGLSEPDAAALLIPAMKDLFQLNVVPAISLKGVYDKGVLLQIPVGVRLLVNDGNGLTTTTTL